MAVVVKNKFSVNGDNVKWVQFPTATILPTGSNVWGCASNGKIWFQVEHGEEMDEPYLDKWWYKVTLGECTDENHNEPLHLYKWIYRCIQECYDPDVTQRTIVYNGKNHRFTTLFSENDKGDRVLRIPKVAFKKDYPTMSLRVLRDNTPLMSAYHLGKYEDEYKSDTFELVCPRDAEEMKRMQGVVATSVEEIDTIVYDLYGFSPENKPMTVDDKVKVAKVLFDWMGRHNGYEDDDDWRDQSLFAALSQGEEIPVCASYAYATSYMLSRYGIVNIYARGLMDGDDAGSSHAWNLINYHAAWGEFPQKDDEWCYIEPQAGRGKVWVKFNFTQPANDYLLNNETWPSTNPSDGEHKYTGNKVYGWDVDYEPKETEETA